ncbi:MAG: acyl-CoA thioesterase [Chloroflexi bacterium]|nr:MAG: acyl-CoA thioesterase [Chloroflexota bacterium]
MPRSASADFPFAYRQRVRFGETDMQGVVYYANYLLYAEVGRFAYLQHSGFDYRRDLLDQGLDFTIASATVRYLSPLRYPDEFDIRVKVGAVRHSSWSFEYLVTRADGASCAEIETAQVVLDRETGRPTRIPAALAERLRA